MKHRAPTPHKALAATFRFQLPAFFLALVLALTLLGPCAAMAAGAVPWLAPQQDNASAAAANATGSNASVDAIQAAAPAAKPSASLPAKPATEPADAAGKAQFEVLRQYFLRQLTLAEDFPEVFSRRVKSGETMAFATMLEMQRRRGLLERFRAAEVDLSELVFTRVTADPDLARIHVTGRYSFILKPKPLSPSPSSADPETGAAKGPAAREKMAASVHETLEEDALFVLLPEQGQWKIYERREGWRP
ncbi:MAG: hypothetical protein KKF77_15065 [Proteobacteria bacterium]|nr:hypothetical protein [Pseudomonadota bacterium]